MTFPNLLRIAVLPLRHLTELNTTLEGKLRFSGGMEAEFIDILSRVLQFEYQLLVPDDGQWGSENDDGTWSGMIGMVHRNEADIAIGHLTITPNRLTAVDLLPYTVEENTFATNLLGFLPKPSFYLAPFQANVWLPCLALLVIMPLVFRALMERKVSVPKIYFSMLGIILSQPLAFTVTAVKDRIIFFVWFAFALVMTFSYRTVLLSTMTVPNQDLGVRTISDLATAITKGKFKATTSAGSTDKELLTSSELEALRIIGENIVEDNWWSGNMIEAPKDFKDFTAILGPRFFFLLEYGEEPFTTKWIFKETVNFWIVGLAIRNSFCCKEQLQILIDRIVSSGIYQKLYQDELFKAQLNFQSKERRYDEKRGLSLIDLSGVFVLLLTGSMISILVFWYEMNRKLLLACFTRTILKNYYSVFRK